MLKNNGYIYVYMMLIMPTLLISNANAQVCMKNITPQTMSSGNFDFTVFGQAKNKLSGLVWDRCVYGQAWDGLTCIGSPVKLSWQEALQVAFDNNKRLPDLKELNSILDLQCIVPPTNLTVFPNTPGSFDKNGVNTNGLWSSTPHIIPDTGKTNAWYIDLGLGFTNYREVDAKNFATTTL